MVLNRSIFEEDEKLLPKSDEELKKSKPSKPKPTKKSKDEVLNEFDLISKKIIELSKKEEAKKVRKPRVLSQETSKKMDRALALGRAKSLETRKAKAELKKMEKAKQVLEAKNNEAQKASQTNKVEFTHVTENPLKSKLNEAIKIIEMQKHAIETMKKQQVVKPSSQPQSQPQPNKPVPTPMAYKPFSLD